MKCCPYCGAEYPDAIVECPIDRQPLQNPAGANSPEITLGDAAAVPQSQMEAPEKSSRELMYPEYRWAARDAWKCMGMILVFYVVIQLLVFGIISQSINLVIWSVSGFGYLFRALVIFVIALLTAAYFARTETLADFWKAFGFGRKPTPHVWFGLVCALVLRALGHFILMNGWSRGVRESDIAAFKGTLGYERFLFLVPLLMLAPLFEEAINRGFLYRAFRGSHSIRISTGLIIGWTALTHWNQYSVSWEAALVLSLVTIVQCYLREVSDSLWDCILCHMAFNGSVLLFAIR